MRRSSFLTSCLSLLLLNLHLNAKVHYVTHAEDPFELAANVDTLSLRGAIHLAEDGDIIELAQINGQRIVLSAPLPLIDKNLVIQHSGPAPLELHFNGNVGLRTDFGVSLHVKNVAISGANSVGGTGGHLITFGE